jgi:hypothetical protein
MSRELLTEAKRIRDKYDDLKAIRTAEFDEIKAQVDRRDEKLRAMLETVLRVASEVREMAPRIALIAEEPVIHQIHLILTRLEITTGLRRKDVAAFDMAARKELGAPRSRVSGIVNRAKRAVYIRVWRQSAKSGGSAGQSKDVQSKQKGTEVPPAGNFSLK